MKKLMIIIFLFSFFEAAHIFGQTSTVSNTSVKIWKESVTIPTYQIAPSSISPMFYDGRSYQGAQGRIYPYALNQSLTNKKVDEEHDMVFLENKYIKIDVFPEIGGRVWGAKDKTNKYEFLYRQHVIKQ